MSFGYFLLICFYFILPAYFTNMTPPLAKKAGILKFLDREVDFGKTYEGFSIFGAHKTWRGVILGILVGMVVVWLQVWLYQFSLIREISLFDYTNINFRVGGWFVEGRWVGSSLFGFLISSGAVLGDLLFSFLKRRLKMKPGQRWLPFDQTDYIIGAFLIVNPFLRVSPLIWLTIFALTFFLHLLVTRIGYQLKICENKW